jgi:hypothetical protein
MCCLDILIFFEKGLSVREKPGWENVGGIALANTFATPSLSLPPQGGGN